MDGHDLYCPDAIEPLPPFRLCFQHPIEVTSSALPLAAGYEIEEPYLAASVGQANASNSFAGRCHHTEVVGIRDPDARIVGGLVAKRRNYPVRLDALLRPTAQPLVIE
jgi:hypothetical protein